MLLAGTGKPWVAHTTTTLAALYLDVDRRIEAARRHPPATTGVHQALVQANGAPLKVPESAGWWSSRQGRQPGPCASISRVTTEPDVTGTADDQGFIDLGDDVVDDGAHGRFRPGQIFDLALGAADGEHLQVQPLTHWSVNRWGIPCCPGGPM